MPPSCTTGAPRRGPRHPPCVTRGATLTTLTPGPRDPDRRRRTLTRHRARTCPSVPGTDRRARGERTAADAASGWQVGARRARRTCARGPDTGTLTRPIRRRSTPAPCARPRPRVVGCLAAVSPAVARAVLQLGEPLQVSRPVIAREASTAPHCASACPRETAPTVIAGARVRHGVPRRRKPFPDTPNARPCTRARHGVRRSVPRVRGQRPERVRCTLRACTSNTPSTPRA
jgi:hypothetical protein